MYIRLVNTKNQVLKSTITNAILNPSQHNTGLWTFAHIPKVSEQFLNELPNKKFNEISYDISCMYNLDKEIGNNTLIDIIDKSFNFPIVTKQLEKNLSICELYHGKSMSFKDIGTSFTYNIIQQINPNQKLKLITATTGDTGSAVASAYYNIPNIDVHILYPKNKITEIQRKQMTTFDKNIKCYEVNGNFDDCQKIVKKLLNDKDIKNITTNNSINIGHILGQLFYYFEMTKNHLDKKINISIPTGNLGNGLSCFISKQMGLPINDIILAVNNNSNLPKILNNENANKKNSFKTLSNAIDINYPSNFERLEFYLKKDSHVNSTITDDREILYLIHYLQNKYNIIADPHTALAADGLLRKHNIDLYNPNYHNIIVSTADPIKFYNEIDNSKFNFNINNLDDLLKKKENFIEVSNNYDEIKNLIR